MENYSVMDVNSHNSIHDISFFQLLRKLQHAYGGSLFQDKKIELRSSNQLNFPSSDIKSLDTNNDNLIVEMNVMGMIGSDGCLPNYYNDILQIESESNQRLKDFLDIFHHHIYELMFCAWKLNQPDIAIELGDNYWQQLFSHLFPRLDQREQPLEICQVFSNKHKSLKQLKQLLNILFPQKNSRLTIVPAVWRQLGASQVLGVTELQLAENVVLGDRYLLGSHQVDIVIECFTYSEYQALIQQKDSFQKVLHRFLDIHIGFKLRVKVEIEAGYKTLGIDEICLSQNSSINNKKFIICYPLCEYNA
jgi:type VI secretion system protein ImpH